MIKLINFALLFGFIHCITVKGPFTDDFRNWLEISGYADYNFPLLYMGDTASYGGRIIPNSALKHRPIVFIHGNSDGALDNGIPFNSGWTSTIQHFLEQGYTTSELYALTWGDRNLNKSLTRTHSCATMLRIRRFVEAVLTYTNSTEIDIIAHSMGVTLSRQIIQGGTWKDDIETCSLGENINSRIHTIVGIAGANYGLCTCTGDFANQFAACGKVTGFYAGNSCQKVPKAPFSKHYHKISSTTCSNTPLNSICKPEYSTMLMQLNNDDEFKEAKKVYSFWSDDDEIVGKNTVWGRYTSLIPNSDNYLTFNGLKHHELKTNTAASQYLAITVGLNEFAKR